MPTAVRPPAHRLSTLPSGVRVVTIPMRERVAATVSFMVAVGSRSETEADSGISHFIEHMVFKGSKGYPSAREISESLEAVGGSSNAATDREATVFWAKVPVGHTERAIDVLSDMLRHPLLEADEVSKERLVVVEELRMYLDNPQDHVHTVFDEVLWPQHPLGRDVAGTAETVMGFDAPRCRAHMERNYTPKTLVVAVAGNVDPDAVEAMIEARVTGWLDAPARPPEIPAAPTGPERLRIVNRHTEQANIVIGARAASYTDPDRFTVDIANAILGDGMSSRLFLELREARGLAYEVYSFTTRLRDSGAMCISIGCEPRRAAQAIQAARGEFERLATEPVPEAELEKAKAYSIGRLLLHLDSTSAISNFYGQQELLTGGALEPEEVVARLEAVTPQDVMRVVSGILADGLRGAIIGPFRGRERLEQALIA